MQGSAADWFEAMRLAAGSGKLRKRRVRAALNYVQGLRRFQDQGGR